MFSSLYQSLETRSLKLPEGTVVPNNEITLPHVFVGDEAYPLTTYLMKPYCRRTLDKSQAIFNYRLSSARRVVECAFDICASKWRILEKATETKVDTGVGTVKCIALLRNIIIDVEGLHDSSSNHCGSLDANDGTQFKKNPENVNLLPPQPNKRETYFVNISTVQLVLYCCKRKLLEMRSNSKPSLYTI
jgi:hypothetical protein